MENKILIIDQKKKPPFYFILTLWSVFAVLFLLYFIRCLIEWQIYYGNTQDNFLLGWLFSEPALNFHVAFAPIVFIVSAVGGFFASKLPISTWRYIYMPLIMLPIIHLAVFMFFLILIWKELGMFG